MLEKKYKHPYIFQVVTFAFGPSVYSPTSHNLFLLSQWDTARPGPLLPPLLLPKTPKVLSIPVADSVVKADTS